MKQEKTQEELTHHVSNLLRKEEEKRNNLKELNIEYEFPGYV